MDESFKFYCHLGRLTLFSTMTLEIFVQNLEYLTFKCFIIAYFKQIKSAEKYI